MSPAETPLDGRALRVQTVLYGQDQRDLERLVSALGNTVQRTKEHSALRGATLVVGDCSDTPAVPAEHLASIKEMALGVGIDGLDYRYFGANLGHAGGHNRLLEDFAEELVVFLNPDAYPSPDLLLELAVPLADERCGIVEARQIPLEHPKSYDLDSGDTSWACLAGAMVRREVIEATGGFDAESFFLYCDDVDLSWRAKLAGFEVRHRPTALIFHDKRLDEEGRIVVNEAEVYYAAEAAMLLAYKYGREDLAEEWYRALAESPLPLRRQAAGEFARRRAEGRLPGQLDLEGRAAQFHGLNFAVHRFSYDD